MNVDWEKISFAGGIWFFLCIASMFLVVLPDHDAYCSGEDIDSKCLQGEDSPAYWAMRFIFSPIQALGKILTSSAEMMAPQTITVHDHD